MKKLAEFVGILLGDGSINVYPRYKGIKISFHSDDVEYIDFVSKLIKHILKETPILKKRKNENTKDLFIFKRHCIRFLLDLGLKKSPKWNRAIIPEIFMNKELGKYVLRGYFDTDGSLVLTNNNGTLYPRLEMKISPSPMLNQFKDLLKIFNFRFGCYDIGKGKVRIQMNGKNELIKWKDLIGFSNPKHFRKLKQIL